jgi:hypothetical protein
MDHEYYINYFTCYYHVLLIYVHLIYMLYNYIVFRINHWSVLDKVFSLTRKRGGAHPKNLPMARLPRAHPRILWGLDTNVSDSR